MTQIPRQRRISSLARKPADLIAEAKKILKERAPGVSIDGMTGGDAEWVIGEARRGKREAELDWLSVREIWELLGNGTSLTAVEDGVIVACEETVIRHVKVRHQRGEDISTPERVWGTAPDLMAAMGLEHSSKKWRKVMQLNRTKNGPICSQSGSKFYFADRIALSRWTKELFDVHMRKPAAKPELDEQKDGYSYGRAGVRVFPGGMHEVQRRHKKR